MAGYCRLDLSKQTAQGDDMKTLIKKKLAEIHAQYEAGKNISEYDTAMTAAFVKAVS